MAGESTVCSQNKGCDGMRAGLPMTEKTQKDSILEIVKGRDLWGGGGGRRGREIENEL